MASIEQTIDKKVGPIMSVLLEKLSKKHSVTTLTTACGITINKEVVVADFALHPMFSNTCVE
jgi:hypothetical protein